MDAGYRVHLANPGAIQQYSGLKHTDDHSDARWLAHLLRLGVLPEGYIYPKAQRPLRDLLRKLGHLVEQQTSNVLSVQNIFTGQGRHKIGGSAAAEDGPKDAFSGASLAVRYCKTRAGSARPSHAPVSPRGIARAV